MIENVETRENGEIQLSEILQRINHKFTSNNIGGIIKRLYPSITSKKVRNQNDWTKTTVLYQEISFKSPLEKFDKIQKEPPYLHFLDIPKYGGADIFRIKVTEKEITMGYSMATASMEIG